MEKKGVWTSRGSKTVLLLMLVVIFIFLVGSPLNVVSSLTEALTGSGITAAVSEGSSGPFNLNSIPYMLILVGSSLFLFIFVIGKLFKKKKVEPEFVPEPQLSVSEVEEKPQPRPRLQLRSKPKELAIKQWRGKKILPYSEELDAIDQELSSLREVEPERGQKVILPPKIERKAKRRKVFSFKPVVLKAPSETFRKELQEIDQKLKDVDKTEQETVKIKTAITPKPELVEKREVKEGFFSRLFKKKEKPLKIEKPILKPGPELKLPELEKLKEKLKEKPKSKEPKLKKTKLEKPKLEVTTLPPERKTEPVKEEKKKLFQSKKKAEPKKKALKPKKKVVKPKKKVAKPKKEKITKPKESKHFLKLKKIIAKSKQKKVAKPKKKVSKLKKKKNIKPKEKNISKLKKKKVVKPKKKKSFFKLKKEVSQPEQIVSKPKKQSKQESDRLAGEIENLLRKDFT